MKYIVMECHLSYAVVLGEDGSFKKAANLHYEVGQTVTDIIEMQEPEPVRKKSRKWIYSLAAAAACMLLVMTSVLQMGQEVYASVYLKINPEVKIDVNQKDQVVALKGTNEDGELLIEDYEYRKKELDQVMDELVDRAVEKGFLHAGGRITLSLDAEDEEWVVTHRETLSSQLNERLTESMQVTIVVSDKKTQSYQVKIPEAPEPADGDSAYGEDVSEEQAETRDEPEEAEDDEEELEDMPEEDQEDEEDVEAPEKEDREESEEEPEDSEGENEPEEEPEDEPEEEPEEASADQEEEEEPEEGSEPEDEDD